jgi:hypothetical protein
MAQLLFDLTLTGTAPDEVATKEQLEDGINASVAQAYTDMDAKVAAEAALRAAADATLQDNIDDEETARIAADALKAPLASPALTGTPTAPTAAPGTNTTQIATTAFTNAAVAVETAARVADVDAEEASRAKQGQAALINLGIVAGSAVLSDTTWTVSWSTARGRMGGAGIDVADVTGMTVAVNQAAVISVADTSPFPVSVVANDSALRRAIESGEKIALLLNRAGALSGILAPHLKIAAAQATANEAVGLAGDAAEEALQAAGIASAALFGSSGDGSLWLLSDSDNDYSRIICDENGNIQFAWDANGTQVYPDPVAVESDLPEYMGYIDGTEIHGVAADDAIMADVSPFTVLSVAPGRGHVKAVVSRELIGATSYVAAADGLLISASDEVIHGGAGTGQSLMAGSYGDIDIPTAANPWPDDALMFQTSSGVDVRMGLPVSGTIPDLVPADLTGFAAAASVSSPASSGYGVTPVDRAVMVMSDVARQRGVRYVNVGMVSARGGTSYAELKKNGTIPEIYDNLIAGVQRAHDLAAAQGKRFVVDKLFWKHGEADQSDTPAEYAAKMVEYQADFDADVKAITGQAADVKVIMAQPSSFLASGGPSLAMANLHRANPLFSLSGPDYPYQDEYNTDLLHFKGPGYFMIGEKAGQAAADALWRPAGKSQPLIVTSVSRAGATVTVNVSVPYGPMQIDTTAVPIASQYGLKYSVGGVDVPVSAVTITDTGNDGAGVITLTLAITPAGTDGRLDVGWPGHSSGANRLTSTIPRTNIRDSDPAVSDYDGRSLYNWLAHDQITHA